MYVLRVDVVVGERDGLELAIGRGLHRTVGHQGERTALDRINAVAVVLVSPPMIGQCDDTRVCVCGGVVCRVRRTM
jgi:hypothetical protein